jgi:hypothetical protein
MDEITYVAFIKIRISHYSSLFAKLKQSFFTKVVKQIVNEF